MSTALERIVSLSPGDPSFEEAAENYVDDVQRLWTAAEMMGLEGLQTICTFVSDNVKVLATQDATARKKAKPVLAAWPDLVLSYLGAPSENVIPMLNHFRETEWAKPLPDDQAHSLLQQLTQGSTAEAVTAEEEAYQCPTIATAEDVLIELPEDINPELLEAYLSEAPQHTAEFSECIQSIIQDPQVAEIHRAQRIAHTLKGSSNIIGIKGIANIAHRLEDTLEYLEEKQVAPPKALTNMMVEAADCLESMVDSLTGQGESPSNAQQIFQDVLDWTNRILKGQMDAPPTPTKRPTPAPETAQESGAKSQTGAPVETKEKKKAAAPAAGAPEQVLKVPTRTIDNLMRLVGELSISVGQMQDRIKHLATTARLLTENNFTTQQKTFELENLVDIRGVTGVKGQGESSEEDEEFDPLEMEEYNELHSVAHSFIESISDSREMGTTIRQDLSVLDNMLVQHERLNREFQNSVMTTRMLPATTIIQKLQRNVRQTSRATGKRAKLDVRGSDIMVDSDVLNKLADPLMHIIRNAIDHGLEPNDEREILGKSAEGTVKLEFYREGNFSVGLQVVDNPGTRAAAAGVTGFDLYENYRGDFVLSAYAPINVSGLTWAVFSEIQELESLEELEQLTTAIRDSSIPIALIVLLLGGAAGFLFFGRVAAPIGHIEGIVTRVAEGDFTARADIKSDDELGALSNAFNGLLDDRLSALAKSEKENEMLNNSIIELLKASFQLSQRDLTVQVPVTEDVTGPLADAINQMASETSKVLLDVRHISEEVEGASAQVKTQGDNVSKVAETEREVVDTTMTELSAAAEAMNKIAEVAESCNEIASQATRSTQVALSTVTSTVDGISEIRETIRETEKRIKRLGERAQEISGIVDIINNIAERTHVLALNASMQAAAAGEAGRGFSVVADEVQRLAESSRNATSQISALVKNIQVETNDTIATMDKTINQVVEGSRLAERAGEQMKETQHTTADLVQVVEQITIASREQAKISDELRERAKTIQLSTHETARQLEEQTIQTDRLVNYSKTIDGIHPCV